MLKGLAKQGHPTPSLGPAPVNGQKKARAPSSYWPESHITAEALENTNSNRGSSDPSSQPWRKSLLTSWAFQTLLWDHGPPASSLSPRAAAYVRSASTTPFSTHHLPLRLKAAVRCRPIYLYRRGADFYSEFTYTP